MNGSNSLSETDSQPIHFCPVCDRKLAWNIGYDQARRYEGLRNFYSKHELTHEAEWMEARIKNWKLMADKEERARDKDE